jgi:hypothetical protein
LRSRRRCHHWRSYFRLFWFNSVVFFTVIPPVVFETSGKVVLFVFPKGLEDFIEHVEDYDD